jgi:hypothetical protein
LETTAEDAIDRIRVGEIPSIQVMEYARLVDITVAAANRGIQALNNKSSE